jgi:predicted nucleic acid-binding protein
MPVYVDSFLIGAQAEDEGVALITRDVQRYKTYFPAVRLISPGQ